MRDPGRSDSPASPDEPASARALERAYGRTWELELLISGAVTFALLQLPSAVDEWFLRRELATGGLTADALALTRGYVKLILYTLIPAFLLHLTGRAYWVGLIGLDSVFPRGVRWKALRYGPATEAAYRSKQPPLQALIRRTDRFCSVIFSTAFVIVFLWAASILYAAFFGLVALAVSWLFFGGDHGGRIFSVLFLAALAPPLLAQGLDWAFGRRLARRGRVSSALRGILRFYYYRLMFGVVWLPALHILFSHLGRRAAEVVFGAVIALLIAFLVVNDELIPEDRLAVEGYHFLPMATAASGVQPRHYDAHAGDEWLRNPSPSIQSDIVREPFVRLFLPYLPDLHNPAVREHCPGVEPLRPVVPRILPRSPAPPPVERTAPVLACLARLQPVSLNGERRSDLRFRFATHPRTGLRGIVAYIPTASLPEGENLLVVEPVPVAEEDLDEDDPLPVPHHIPFWVGRGVSDAAGPSRDW